MSRSTYENAVMQVSGLAETLFTSTAFKESTDTRFDRPLPRSILPKATELAITLLDCRVNQPERLAHFIRDVCPPLAADYSESMWCIMRAVNNELEANPDWGLAFTKVHAPRIPELETNWEDAAEETVRLERVKEWARVHGHELAVVNRMLHHARHAFQDNHDFVAEIDRMLAGIASFHDGEQPNEDLCLSVTLEQGMTDGSSHGSLVYEITVGENCLKVEKYGDEWAKGVGSDSWSGPCVEFGPCISSQDIGSLDQLHADFLEVSSPSFAPSIMLNGDTICYLPYPEWRDSEPVALVKQIVRGVIGSLQKLAASDNSGRKHAGNLWETICRASSSRATETERLDLPAPVIHRLIMQALDNLAEEERHTLINGLSDLTTEQSPNANEVASKPEAAIADHIYTKLMEVAGEYMNRRLMED